MFARPYFSVDHIAACARARDNGGEEDDWSYKLTNDQVYHYSGAKNIISFIEEQQLFWYAHIIRQPNSSLTKRLLFSDEPNRRRGRPLLTLRASICDRYEKSESDINKMCFERKQIEILNFRK